MHDSDSEEIYGLEPEQEQAKRGPAPPTSPDTAPGSTGSTLVDAAMQRRQATRALRESSSDVVTKAYVQPLMMLAIGLAITCTILLIVDGPAMVAIYGVTFVASVPIGVAVYFLFCLVWLGFDTPMHLIALQLAGIYAVTDATRIGCGIVPYLGGLLMLFVPILIYIWLLSEILEIELGEALAVGIVTFVAKVLAAVVLMSVMT